MTPMQIQMMKDDGEGESGQEYERGGRRLKKFESQAEALAYIKKLKRERGLQT